MIFLIGLFGCKSEDNEMDFTGSEQLAYNNYKGDFTEPHYPWGYIDENANLVIESKFHDAREFNEGIAAVMVNGLWGYINQKGNYIIQPRFKTLETFQEGRGIGQDWLGKYHILDSYGIVISDSLDLDEIHPFSNSLSRFKEYGLYGYLDHKGIQKISNIYESASDFKNGWAIVSQNELYGIIDTAGNTIIPMEYDKLWFPSSNMIRYKLSGKYGFLNLHDFKKSTKLYNSATDFHEEHAVVNDGDNFFLIDKVGVEKLLPFTYVDVGGEGTWMYMAENQYGFLSNNGEVTTLPQYDLLMRFREGKAGFAKNELWGYINKKGETLVPARFPLVWDYVNNKARYISRYGFGFLNQNGDPIIPSRFIEARDFSEGLARVQTFD